MSNIWRNVSTLIIFSLGLILILTIFTYSYFFQDLATEEGIMNRKDTGVMLMDKNNKPFFSFYQAREKLHVPLSEIPLYTQQAVIAAEDNEFYTHKGFSVRGIIRSIILNFRDQDLAYGGSTITQQLVKNSLLSSQKNFLRKYQELILAYEIERRYSKNAILEMYLNSVYFGEGAFGIEEAALTYFGKPAKNLTIAESSILAAILPLPSKLSPYNGGLDELKKRQKLVLEQMQKLGYISEEINHQAQTTVFSFIKRNESLNELAPHFALFIKQQLIDTYGEEYIARSGLKVKTTLDSTWQEIAEETVRNHVERLANQGVTNGGAVAIDSKTGEIRVMVGSKDWYNNEFGKVNVTIANRPPGSAFKPIIYAKAFEDEIITPATTLHDKPTTFQGSYKPRNFDNRFRGNVTVRRALANSLNVPSVEVMDQVGVENGLEMANRLGITNLKNASEYGLSLVLGAGEVSLLELTNVYGTFANNGAKNEITAILEIQDKHGRILFSHKHKSTQVIDEKIAYLISSILSDSSSRKEVFGSSLSISRPAAVKTGTTEDYRDSLTIGYTPSLVIGVWVGNNNNKPMEKVAGSLGAAPIWRFLMENFLKGTIVETFEKPNGIIAYATCILTKDATPSSRMEYFIEGTEPIKDCSIPTITASPTPTATPTPESIASEENQDAEKRIGGFAEAKEPSNKEENDEKEKKSEEFNDSEQLNDEESSPSQRLLFIGQP